MGFSIDIPFFGRDEHIRLLRERCASPGLTIVKGPPRIGKTRLLREFVTLVRDDGKQQIGFAAAGEADGDVLLRAIKDAFNTWMADSTFVDQIRVINTKMKGRWISGVGTALGKALAGFAGPGEKLVELLFDGLKEAQRGLTSQLELPKLSSDEAKELLTILALKPGPPAVIVLNQWEESQDLERDVGTLRTFLSDLREWPSAHVVVHLRDPRFPEDRNKEANRHATGLLTFPAASCIEVEALALEDAGVFAEVRVWVDSNFSVLRDVDDDILREQISGQPGVFDDWSYHANDSAVTVESLFEVAGHARAKQYPELWTIYERLLDDATDDAGRAKLQLAILAAVLPLPNEAAAEDAILPAVLGSATPADITDLASRLLLRNENGLKLSLGHPTREEAAASCVLGLDPKRELADDSIGKRLRPFAREAVERAIIDLADLHAPEEWDRLDDETSIAAAVMAHAQDLISFLDADPVPRLICAAAQALFKHHEAAGNIEAALTAEIRHLSESVRLIVAVGLFNAIMLNRTDSNRIDGVLAAIEGLRSAYPRDDAVRERMAKGLVNAISVSGEDTDRADRLLETLDGLRREHADDEAMRQMLAKGLFNAISNSGDDPHRADRLLTTLEELQQGFADDEAVRESLANGLFNAITVSGEDPDRADRHVATLLELRREYTDDDTVRAELAKGLVNAISDSAEDAGRTDRHVTTLLELRRECTDDDTVRAELAHGLVNAIATGGADLVRADHLLRALEDLRHEFADDEAVRMELAMGLVNALLDSGQDADRTVRLLMKLGDLRREYADDDAITEPLVRGVTYVIATAAGAKDLEWGASAAETAASFADDIRAEPDYLQGIRTSVKMLLSVAIEDDEKDLARRLTAASRVLFSDHHDQPPTPPD